MAKTPKKETCPWSANCPCGQSPKKEIAADCPVTPAPCGAVSISVLQPGSRRVGKTESESRPGGAA